MRKIRRITPKIRFQTTYTFRIWGSHSGVVKSYVFWDKSTDVLEEHWLIFNKLHGAMSQEINLTYTWADWTSFSGALQDKNSLLAWNRAYWIPLALISPHSFLFRVKVEAFETGYDVFLQRSKKELPLRMSNLVSYLVLPTRSLLCINIENLLKILRKREISWRLCSS